MTARIKVDLTVLEEMTVNQLRKSTKYSSKNRQAASTASGWCGASLGAWRLWPRGGLSQRARRPRRDALEMARCEPSRQADARKFWTRRP